MYERFRQLMSERNITSYQVSKDTGVSQTTLSYWKSGRSKPKLDKIIKIAIYFNVPLDELIKEDDIPEDNISMQFQ